MPRKVGDEYYKVLWQIIMAKEIKVNYLPIGNLGRLFRKEMTIKIML